MSRTGSSWCRLHRVRCVEACLSVHKESQLRTWLRGSCVVEVFPIVAHYVLVDASASALMNACLCMHNSLFREQTHSIECVGAMLAVYGLLYEPLNRGASTKEGLTQQKNTYFGQ